MTGLNGLEYKPSVMPTHGSRRQLRTRNMKMSGETETRLRGGFTEQSPLYPEYWNVIQLDSGEQWLFTTLSNRKLRFQRHQLTKEG